VLRNALQRLGYFPKLRAVPTAIVSHIRSGLPVEQDGEPRDEEPRTLYRHHQAIRTSWPVTVWGQAARRLIIKAAAGAAETMDHPADLIHVALETLIKERYTLPAFSTLDRLVRRVRTVVHQRYLHTSLTRLSPADTTRLDGRLNPERHGFRSPYQRLKQRPKRPSLQPLRAWLAQWEWLLSRGDSTHLLADLPPLTLTHVAAEARALDAAELKDVAPPKRYTRWLYWRHRMRVQCRDQLALMVINRLQTIQQRGQDELEELRLRYRERTATLVSLLAEVVTTSEHAASDAQAGSSIRPLLAERGPATPLLEACEPVMADRSDHDQPLLWRYDRHDRQALLRRIRQLARRSTSQDQSLTPAVRDLLEHEERRRDGLPDAVDRSLASERWLRLSYGRHQGERRRRRHHCAVCVCAHLAGALTSGDLSSIGSEESTDSREPLLPGEACVPMVADYGRALELPATAPACVARLRAWLTDTARPVDAGSPDHEPLVIDAHGQPRLKQLPKAAPRASVRELEAVIHRRVPERQSMDILVNIAHDPNWIRHVGPLSGSDPQRERALARDILTAFA
jgi:hypothetical protein